MKNLHEFTFIIWIPMCFTSSLFGYHCIIDSACLLDVFNDIILMFSALDNNHVQHCWSLIVKIPFAWNKYLCPENMYEIMSYKSRSKTWRFCKKLLEVFSSSFKLCPVSNGCLQPKLAKCPNLKMDTLSVINFSHS